MALKLNPLYKRGMLVVMVVGPLWWLMLTDDGRHRADLVLMTLFGKPSLDLNLNVLDSSYNEPELRELFPDLDWHCGETQSPLGERYCGSELGAFNGLPARFASFHFHNDKLNAFQVGYRKAYHEHLLTMLNGLGDRQHTLDKGVHRWRDLQGVFALPSEPLVPEDHTLIWVAGSEL
ncbi:MAG: hypothetical protein ACWA5Q_12105 [bacterium]